MTGWLRSVSKPLSRRLDLNRKRDVGHQNILPFISFLSCQVPGQAFFLTEPNGSVIYSLGTGSLLIISDTQREEMHGIAPFHNGPQTLLHHYNPWSDSNNPQWTKQIWKWPVTQSPVCRHHNGHCPVNTPQPGPPFPP